MSTNTANFGLFTRLKLRWFLFLRWVLHLWVKTNTLPQPFEDLELSPDKPFVYIIDSYALSSLLILDRVCEDRGLPRPLWPMQIGDTMEPRSYLALRRKKGLIIRRTEVRRHSATLKGLVERICEKQTEDIQLVPVTVLIGRAPDKETGLAKIFFTESWDIGGRIWRFFNSLVNGRHTMLQFSNPISLRESAEEELDTERNLRKVSRILRVHFQRVRSAAIGPDLSHRRTVVDSVLRSPGVRKAILEQARKEKISELKARKQARKYAFEIAANYSYGFVRVASFALTWFWNRIYDGVELKHFRRFQEQAPNYEIIYVPCHRSHIDYLLFSYFIYHNGLVPPHVAAGVNLNLPILGRFLRKGGAFFLRRSFRSQKLYSAVFHEYLTRIMSIGTSIEYYIEGTRSRTGRLLQPKGGMLSMTVRSYLGAPVRPVMFQPIYVGYERLVEGSSYTKELSGQKKKTESLGDLLKVFGILKQRYGKVHVSFAQPVFLDDMLERYDANWRENTADDSKRPPWLSSLVDDLGQQIMTGINESTHVNAINLLAVTLLTSRKLAMGREELQELLNLLLELLSQCRYSERITYTSKSAGEIINYGVELGAVEILKHPLGDIVSITPQNSTLLAYYRNNIAHLVAAPSLVASCFLNQRVITREQLRHIALSVFPFMRAELFLPWDEDEFLQALDHHLGWMLREKLLSEDEDGETLRRPASGDRKEPQLRVIGHMLLQTFERYYITLAVLDKNGSGTLTRGDLEKLCFLSAQRISLLSEFSAPEFSDRYVFRQFIALLRELGVLTTNADEKLEFDDKLLQISEDARYILSEEIRQGIFRVAPQVLTRPDQE